MPSHQRTECIKGALPRLFEQFHVSDAVHIDCSAAAARA